MMDRLLKDEDKEEDLIFLTDQKEGRKMHIGEGDINYTKKVELRRKAFSKQAEAEKNAVLEKLRVERDEKKGKGFEK